LDGKKMPRAMPRTMNRLPKKQKGNEQKERLSGEG
jgi:hypothetical protein